MQVVEVVLQVKKHVDNFAALHGRSTRALGERSCDQLRCSHERARSAGQLALLCSQWFGLTALWRFARDLPFFRGVHPYTVVANDRDAAVAADLVFLVDAHLKLLFDVLADGWTDLWANLWADLLIGVRAGVGGVTWLRCC